MRSRRAVSAAMAAMVLAAGLTLGATPALAANSRPAAGTPVGASATLVIHTVPRIRGVRVILDGRAFQTDPQGFVAIPTTSGRHHVHILRPRSHPADTTVRFSRWLDGVALADRTISISPGTNIEQAGFVVAHPIAVRFADSRDRPVALSNVTRLTIDSSLGKRFTFSPTHPPQALDVNRIVRNPAGLVPMDIRYSVRDVIIDGANVVYGGSQNFYVHRSRTWTVKILLFPLQIKVQDALFGFPIGSAVRLTLPNGSSRIVLLGTGHSVTLAELPRATYQLVAKGPGFGLASPATLSKPQAARLLLLSWVDILAVLTFAAFFLVGLPVLGGRIVRRKGRIRLPVWHGGRSRELPPVPAPEEPVGGTPVPGSATEEPAVTSQPSTASAEDGSVGQEPAATAAQESEAVTEVFAAISDTSQAEGPGQSAGPDVADHAPSPGMANEPRTRAASVPAACPPAAAAGNGANGSGPAARPPAAAAGNGANGSGPAARPPAAAAGNGANGSGPAARPPAAAAGNGANGSVPPAAGSRPYTRPVSPWVKRTTWPTWNGRKL